MKPFEILEHTADVAIAAYGATLEELFANAALGMFSIIGDVSKVAPKETHEIRLSGRDADVESMLVHFLAELLYEFETKHFIVRDVAVTKVSEQDVCAEVHGEPIGPQHDIYTEIKAVTRHALKVERTGEGWRATVLFDL